MKVWQRVTRFQWALALSIGFHAALLSLRLAAPAQFDRMFKDTPLDVILVNTRLVSEAPDKAQALAQTQLAGGGEQRTGRAASPLPSAATTTTGDSADNLRKQMASMQKQQAVLLAQVKDLLAKLPPPQPQKSQTSPDALEEKRRQLLKLLAEIEQRIEQENARPRKHYISPATREAIYALYYDALKRKIEERGTLYFPERGGQKIYGELTMVITVNTDGRVLHTEVVQSSGQADLDRRAQAIATAAGPFGNFTPAMRKQADQLAIVSRFIFSRNNTLETRGGEGVQP